MHRFIAFPRWAMLRWVTSPLTGVVKTVFINYPRAGGENRSYVVTSNSRRDPAIN